MVRAAPPAMTHGLENRGEHVSTVGRRDFQPRPSQGSLGIELTRLASTLTRVHFLDGGNAT